jgi:succinyl-diaminopimelate desuccinylase
MPILDPSVTSLRAAVDGERDAILGLAQELIALPTENPPGGSSHYRQAVQLLCERLRGLGFDDVAVEGECVLCFAGAGERTLYWSGHYDVVPAQDPRQFEPRIERGALFGRGSSDMKGGLAAMIFAAKALRDLGLLAGGRLGLVFVPDEETAGPRGSRYLADRGILGRDAAGMLTPEPTGGVVWHANRGAISLRVTVPGKTAHVGRQFAGVNAFERMLPLAQSLLRLKAEVEQRATSHPIEPAAARRSILMLGGCASSGANFNVVPEACSFTVDRRINPEEDLEVERRRLLDAIAESGIPATVDIFQEGHASATPEDQPLARALAASVAAVTGRAPRFELCPGLLETRFYAHRGIPALAYGPGLLSVSHGPDEMVPIDRLLDCAVIYALTAARLFQASDAASGPRPS